MNLYQAIDIISTLALTPDDQLPPEKDWPIIETAITTVQAAIATQQYEGYTKRLLTDIVSTSRMVIALAKAGGWDAIGSVLADENTSVMAWLDEIVV